MSFKFKLNSHSIHRNERIELRIKTAEDSIHSRRDTNKTRRGVSCYETDSDGNRTNGGGEDIRDTGTWIHSFGEIDEEEDETRSGRDELCLQVSPN